MALLNKQSIIGNYWKIVQFIFKTGSYSYLLDTASISLQPQLIIEKKIGSEKSQHEGSYLVVTGEPAVPNCAFINDYCRFLTNNLLTDDGSSILILF